MRRWRGPVFAAMLVGCGSSDRVAPDPAAEANAQLPTDLRGRLRFVARTLTSKGKTIAVVAPALWTDFEGDELVAAWQDTPASSSFRSSLTFATDLCSAHFDVTEERCADDDATAQVDRALQRAIVDSTIIRDVRLPTSRTLTVKSRFATYHMHSWWRAGSHRFSQCNATLVGPHEAALPAFEVVCTAMRTAAEGPPQQ